MEHNKLRAYKRVHYYRQEITGFIIKLFSAKKYLKKQQQQKKTKTNKTKKTRIM